MLEKLLLQEELGAGSGKRIYQTRVQTSSCNLSSAPTDKT